MFPENECQGYVNEQHSQGNICKSIILPVEASLRVYLSNLTA